MSLQWSNRRAMKPIVSWLGAALLAVILTVAPTAYYGSRTSRWASAEPLNRAAATLESLPERFGTWTCTDADSLPESARQLLKYEAALSRTYQDHDTSTVMRLVLIVGLPGPIVRHPPEFCYEVGNNIPLGQRVVTFESGGVKHSIRLTRFRESGALGKEFFVATGWFAKGRLGTSDTPRMTYGGEPFIHAMQLAWTTTDDAAHDEAVGVGFLRNLLPAFQEHCLSTAGPPQKS